MQRQVDAAMGKPGEDVLLSFASDTEAFYGRLGGARRLSQRAIESDRKSTRLNSSHVSISYAVFCLKKKKFTACRSRLTIFSGTHGCSLSGSFSLSFCL